MSPISPALPTARHGEAGFSLIVVMGVMFMLLLLSAGAVAAVNGDQSTSRHDVGRKQALAAAEAGIAEYASKLAQDDDYWSDCTNVPEPNAVNQKWTGTGTRKWRTVPGSAAKYTIELLPAPGKTQCVTGTGAAASMIDPATRTLRIRSTGEATDGSKRSVIATFRRASFLDFLYFTELETTDPAWFDVTTDGRATTGSQGSLRAWATGTATDPGCNQYYRDGRENSSNRWSGRYVDTGRSVGPIGCSDIQFATGDVVAGPLHTNDEMLSGNATFGRTASDRIESGVSWRPAFTGANPTFKGTLYRNSDVIGMPPTTGLDAVAATGYRYTGKTTIRLGTNSFTVKDQTMGTAQTKSYPTNGVIHVANGTCGWQYKPLDPYGSPAGCADVTVSGTYGKDLTIASKNDIIVDGDTISSGSSLLGLIAEGFIRVHHDVNRGDEDDDDYDPSECWNKTSGTKNIRIDAAILSLAHSFIVDNYYCGAKLGTLTVNGAIAQYYRGPVGTVSNGTVTSGYVKAYNYNDEFAYRTPPSFIDPVKSAWNLVRNTEQTPAT